MGNVWRGRCARCGAVAALAVIAAGAWLFTAPPKANTALPAKPVVELSPMETPPPGTEAVEMFAGKCPGIIGPCWHGTDESEVYPELC